MSSHTRTKTRRIFRHDDHDEYHCSCSLLSLQQQQQDSSPTEQHASLSSSMTTHSQRRDDDKEESCTRTRTAFETTTPKTRQYSRRRSKWKESQQFHQEMNNESIHLQQQQRQQEEAVQEAKLQVSFAQRTVKEMEQVVQWWDAAKDENGTNVSSQSLSIPDNSLVYDSPQLSEDEEVFHHHDNRVDDDYDCVVAPTTTPYCTTREQQQDLMCLQLQSLALPPPTTINATTPTVATSEADDVLRTSLLSPIVALSDSPPHRGEAQEQSFAVDAVCSQAKQMEDVLAELEDTSVDDGGDDHDHDDDDNVVIVATGNGVVPLQEWSVQDLSRWDRLYLTVKCYCRQKVLGGQYRLSHVLPPTVVSTYLSLCHYHQSRPPNVRTVVRIVLCVLLLPLLLFLLYTTITTIAFHTHVSNNNNNNIKVVRLQKSSLSSCAEGYPFMVRPQQDVRGGSYKSAYYYYYVSLETEQSWEEEEEDDDDDAPMDAFTTDFLQTVLL